MLLRKSGIKAELNTLNQRKGTKITATVSKKKGLFTAGNVTLNEIAINNKILRLHLIRENFKDLINKKSQVEPNLITFSRHKKYPFLRRSKRSNQIHKMVVNNGKVSKCDPNEYFIKELEHKQNSKVLYLKPCPYRPVSEGKLNYKFNQLVNDVKNMQLPTSSWKIKVIIRHNKIAAIIFTNKAELERSLSFNSDDDKYHIVIDNKPALLLGSPGKVNNCSEIEVLLSIMESIEKDSPMILYK